MVAESRRREWGRSGSRWVGRLLRRVFPVDVRSARTVAGVRRLLAAVGDPSSIERVLRAMELPTVALALATDLPW